MKTKLTTPDRIATGQPVNRASAAPRVAQTKNRLRVSRPLVTLEMCSLMGESSRARRFQFLNYTGPPERQRRQGSR